MPRFHVGETEAGQRLDVFLSVKLKDYSRAFVQKIIKDKVLVNSKSARPSHKLKLSDKITVDIGKLSDQKMKKIKLDIIYEDSDCLVVNKPAGILSHSKGSFNEEATVESFISDKISGFDGPRAGIVHRLDRGTSGVMICAKHPEAYKWLQKQFSSRKANKRYAAVVSGHLSKEEAAIDMPIGRNPKAPATFKVSSNGKQALTVYRVVKTSPHYSLLSLEPKTGRTHQLRVHLSYLGHAVVGDSLYKGVSADRLYLHAHSLEIKLPNLKTTKFEVKIPPEFNKIISSDHD